MKIVVEYVGKQERDIGIVSPYSAQVELLIGLGLGKKYEVKTIDSFQGREKNVVIFSGVRASFVSKHMYVNRRRTIGFVADMRRVNVSLSRAKDVCIVVGDLNRLASNSTWRKIIVDAIEKGQAYQMHCNKDYFKGFMKDLNKHRFVLQERKGEEEE